MNVVIRIALAGVCCSNLLMAAPLVARAALHYSVVDLGVLDPKTPSTFGAAINDSGIVVGNSAVMGQPHPFFWNGALHDIGTFGGPTGFAVDINDSGTIVGWADDGPRLFAFKGGQKIDLGIPPNSFDFISAKVNADDVILAQPVGDVGCDPSNEPFTIHLRVSRTPLSLAALCNLNEFGIDDRAEILAQPYINGHFTYGLINSFGRDLDRFGSQANFDAAGLNRTTDVVIGYVSARTVDDIGIFYTPSTNTLVRLPPLSNILRTSQPTAINRAGQIVGTACHTAGGCDGGNVAFLFDPRLGMINLNIAANLPRGFAEYVGTAINNKGQIVVCAGSPPFGPNRTFLLTPVP